MTQRKNVEMGFWAGGTFHPIRSSSDYDSKRGGDDYDWQNKRTPGSKALRQRLRKNVEMGFYAGGTFHPIRASRDYDYSRAGEHDTGKTSQLRSIDAAIRKRDARRNPAMPESKTPVAPKPLSPQTRKLAAILGVRIAKEGRGYKYHTPLGVFNSLTAAAEALQGTPAVKKNPRTETYAEEYNRHLLTVRDSKPTKRNMQRLFAVGALLGKTNLEMQRDLDRTENARLRNNPPRKKNFFPAAFGALAAVRELRTPAAKNPSPDTAQSRAYRDILNILDKVQTTGKCTPAQRAELERLGPLSHWQWNFDKEIAERQKRYANEWTSALLERIRQTGNYTSREAEQLQRIAAQHGVDWVTAQGWLIDAYAHWHKNMPQQTNPGRLSKFAGKLNKAARILDAAQTLRNELRRAKPADKKRNPEVAEAVAQVYEMFQGRPIGEHKTAAAPDGTPDDLAQLGTLSYLKTTQRSVTRTWRFDPTNAPILCADSDGNLHIIGEVITQEPAGDMGALVKIGYITTKDHIGDAQEFDFRHRFGENGGQPPHLHIDAEGFFHIVGGDYRLQAEGIVN